MYEFSSAGSDQIKTRSLERFDLLTTYLYLTNKALSKQKQNACLYYYIPTYLGTYLDCTMQVVGDLGQVLGRCQVDFASES